MQEHVKAHKSLQVQLRNNPNLGSINVLVLMIRFKDHVNRDLVSQRDVADFWETKVPEWMEVNSHGRYTITATVIDWITTDNTEEYYSFGKRGITPEAQKMAWPALDNLDNRPDFDFKKFDLDGNNQIDSLVIMHSGYGSETTSEDCYGRDFDNRIWAHAFSSSNDNAWTSQGGIRVNGYTMASAFDGDCGVVPAKIGLTVHEYMHTFGLEDLYDGVDPLAHHGIGSFDIMANPYGPEDDADYPGHLSTFSKMAAEWIEPVEITASGDYTANAAEISDQAYRITLADFGVTTEYLLIENRYPLEFDINLWNEGLIIYHVDTGADFMYNVGYPGQQGWPENGNHYFVALLPKDGKYDLEQGVNHGDAGDFWVPGDCLGPGKGNTVHPNTDTYGFGFIQETGIWICAKSKSGTEVTFEVGGFNGEPVPESLQQETEAPTAATLAPTVATNSPTAATISPTKLPTIAPTAATLAPTVATNSPTAATISPTKTPTIAPTGALLTTATSNPTATTMSPTAATISPTKLPTPNPTLAAVTRPPTQAPIVPVTRRPTEAPSQTQLTPSIMPFGSHQEVTRRPVSRPSYLQPFGPYSGFPTPTPQDPSSSYLSNFGGLDESSAIRGDSLDADVAFDPYLSSFDENSSPQAPNTLSPYLSNFDGSSAPPAQAPNSYLSGFQSGAQAQLSPPRGKRTGPDDIERENEQVFVSSIYTLHSSSNNLRSSRLVLVGWMCALWQLMI